MLATVHAAVLSGIDALPVIVEAEFTAGLPGFDVVGLPEAAVRESRVRVKAALEANDFSLPKRRLLVNLAPGDLRKTGASFDLGIAIAALAASGACAPNRLPETLALGELGLSGELRAVRGAIAHIRSAKRRGIGVVIVPRTNAVDVAAVEGVDVRVADHLTDVIAYFDGRADLPRPVAPALPPSHRVDLDLADVRGQETARRALEIAAVGMHHLLFVGPPGSGKTMLASRLPGLLAAPSPEEALDIATIAGVADVGPGTPWGTRPFRAPHHQASSAALVGGGDPIRPGEVTLAHGGVLFLDELPEFRREAIEALRITMELGEVHLARARERVRLPARALVVGAMNPCPCGNGGHPKRLCTCPPDRIERYRGRVSGPIRDRFDLHVVVPPVSAKALRSLSAGDSSAVVRARVEEGRGRLLDFKPDAVDPASLDLVDRAVDRMALTARGHGKVLRVARTIAAMEGAERVQPHHVAEALQYRVLDRATGNHAKGMSVEGRSP